MKKGNKNKVNTNPNRKAKSGSMKKASWSFRRPVLAVVIKASVLFMLLGLVVKYCDDNQFFDAEKVNNHTLKKWNYFYEFVKKKDVDVLLVGNSHLYTGINPKNLSCALGVNAFILASPGTSTADYYYTLKEALTVSSPKLVVVETYGINGASPHGFEGSPLADQFKSFSARRNLSEKLKSTPFLFLPKNYPYAWSNTIRNHDYLYNNTEQLDKNVELSKAKKKRLKDLYLGRFVRFQTGLTDSLLAMYVKNGAPVKGDAYQVNDLDKEYVSKIKDLCVVNDVKVMFLTLPMYKDHVHNYSAWKNSLTDVIGSDSNWLDQQDSLGYVGFNRDCFENTYSENQHMTYPGSLLSTYKLASYIKMLPDLELPNRKKDHKWQQLFNGEEGFFENNLPLVSDTINKVIYENQDTGIVRSIVQVVAEKNDKLIVKLLPSSDSQKESFKKKKIRVWFLMKYESRVVQANVDLSYDPYHSFDSSMTYIQPIKKLEVIRINKIEFL